jgi:hypothetical protein
MELRKVFTEALNVLSTFEGTQRFERAVEEFEGVVRVPQFFERAVSENELSKFLDQLKADAEKLSPEKRALAHQIVRGLAEPLWNRWGDSALKQIGELQRFRISLQLLLDFLRMFGNDYDGFVKFLEDAVAFNIKDEALLKLVDWPSKLGLILKLVEQANATPQAEQEKVRANLAEAVSNVLSDIGSGRALSYSMLQTLFASFRPLLSGQPGRPPKDYSREYDLKASGLSWAEVADQILHDNAELRDEFGGRGFDSLSFEERETLTHRIREGVKSYAERAGKTLPIKSVRTMRKPVRPAGK